MRQALARYRSSVLGLCIHGRRSCSACMCTYHSNVKDITEGEIRHELHITMPPFARRYRFPLIVYVQGSARNRSEWKDADRGVSQIARKGYVIAHVDIGTAHAPTAVEAVKRAIRYMLKHTEKYRFDPDRITVWGDSSGGRLALMTVIAISRSVNESCCEESEGRHAAIDYCGIADLRTLGTALC